jgi:4-hydroxy 2-oxovalerate aldolase
VKEIEVLDCTLRDGGYVNDWNFGRENIEKIFGNLCLSGVENIECGFITEDEQNNPDRTKFNNFDVIKKFVEKLNDPKRNCLGMINYGEYDIDKIPEYTVGSIDGIRVTFTNRDYKEALEYCRQIVDKGYKVFLQPMSTSNFSEEQLTDLITETNKINPYAIYIVDSFGSFDEDTLERLFTRYSTELGDKIKVGFHSHNNLQLSFSLAQTLIKLNDGKRDLIVDLSIYGIGRGAGNLNSELFCNYLNVKQGKDYRIEPIIRSIDEVLMKVYEKTRWGYSMPYYLSAKYNVHPNYAVYLSSKNTLPALAIDGMLSSLDPQQAVKFDKDLIERMYIDYQSREIDDKENIETLRKVIFGKNVVLVGPGKSYKEFDFNNLPPDSVLIAINFVPDNIAVEYSFISNAKRYSELDKSKLNQTSLLTTSNIVADNSLSFNYNSLLNSREAVKDNSLLMFLNLLKKMGINSVKLIGCDGYSHDIFDNYYDEGMMQVNSREMYDLMNEGMSEEINNSGMDIEILTKSRFEVESNNED